MGELAPFFIYTAVIIAASIWIGWLWGRHLERVLPVGSCPLCSVVYHDGEKCPKVIELDSADLSWVATEHTRCE